VVAHNLLASIPDGYAITVNLDQAGRDVEGRVGLCRQHKVLNNVLARCPKRVLFSRVDDNQCDGNLYDERDAALSFCAQYPAPQALVDLAAWQRYYGFDQNGAQAEIDAQLDPETLVLTLEVKGQLPQTLAVGALHSPPAPSPGPVVLSPGRHRYPLRVGPPPGR
jgi:hypothetical protein